MEEEEEEEEEEKRRGRGRGRGRERGQVGRDTCCARGASVTFGLGRVQSKVSKTRQVLLILVLALAPLHLQQLYST